MHFVAFSQDNNTVVRVFGPQHHMKIASHPFSSAQGKSPMGKLLTSPNHNLKEASLAQTPPDIFDLCVTGDIDGKYFGSMCLNIDDSFIHGHCHLRDECGGYAYAVDLNGKWTKNTLENMDIVYKENNETKARISADAQYSPKGDAQYSPNATGDGFTFQAHTTGRHLFISCFLPFGSPPTIFITISVAISTAISTTISI